MESADEFQLYRSEDDEEEDTVVKINSKAKQDDMSQKDKQLNLQLLDPSPFRIESIRNYPHRFREGEIPLRLMKVPKIEFLIDS